MEAFSYLHVFYIGIVSFSANVVQFGMDQLYDSPGDDRTLFIHWFVWVKYANRVPICLVLSFAYKFPKSEPFTNYYGVTGYFLLTLAVSMALVITLFLAQYRKRWFLIEPGQYNPYKLVYRVSKYARRHKTPVHRSAFTYCEDEVPMGLDLGKEKYGGPFTTEQVEDVKTFYGIIKVILSAWLVQVASYSFVPVTISSAPAMDCNATAYVDSISAVLNDHALLWNSLVTVCIPLYVCLLRPLFLHRTLGMLRKMGLGVIAMVLAVAMQAVMTYIQNKCIELPSLISAFSYTKLCLKVLSFMLMYM